ncbi:MAG: PTS sugar transporter subunit IIA [Alkalispirochaeta sp.]
MDFSERLWSIQDAASYLHIAEKTVSRMIQRGELPAVRIGGQWRFVPEQLSQWLNDQGARPDSLRDLLRLDPIAVPIDRILKADHIICRSPARSAREVLRELAEKVHSVFSEIDPDEYHTALLAREELASTVIGEGLAVPHIRRIESNPPGSMELFALITASPVHYGGTDCSMFCLICTDDLVLHLRIIQKIAYVLRRKDTIEMLQEQRDPAAVIAAILAAERNDERD